MGGEVVVDYSLGFKKQFGDDVWVAGYCNDVMAYIPSLRSAGRRRSTTQVRPLGV